MNITKQIETTDVLNIDNEESTISANELIFNGTIDPKSYVLSDVDEELIILVEFKQIINLHSIKLYALSNTVNNNNTDACDISPPKQVHIYKIDGLNKNFDDIKSIKSDKSIKCSPKKLERGQNINLKKTSKNSVKFGKTKYLAIYIESNQGDTEKTYLNGIIFKGEQQKYSQQQSQLFDTIDIENRKKFHQISKQCNNKDSLDYTINSKYLLEPHINRNKQSLKRLFPAKECGLSQCPCLQRLIPAMKRYNTFIEENQFNEEKKNETEEEINIDDMFSTDYTELDAVNDFHHLLEVHQYDFEEIYDNLINGCNDGKICILNKCSIMRRNHRDRSLLGKDNNKLRNMYFNCNHVEHIKRQQIFDKIHCHYFHTFDIAHKLSRNDKLKIQQIINNNDDNKDENNDTIHDELVAAIFSVCNKKNNSYTNSTKFTAAMDNVTLEYSFGVKYFYWDFYKNNTNLWDPVACRGIIQRVANDGYYTLADFYIAPKFKDLKEELINNSICSISQYQWDILVAKAESHIGSEYFKHQISINNRSEEIYHIKKGSQIGHQHLMAMMTYCNQDQLQRQFSKTYRRIPKNENILSLKSRHKNYAHLGRLLREAVDCFAPTTWKHHGFRSLYHGMRIQTQFSSTYCAIRGPVSASTSYAVAVNFSAPAGIILEFGLDRIWTLHNFDRRLCMFECAYISDYPSEKEIFFIGGYSMFVIQSIIRAPYGLNYEHYVKALAIISTFFSLSGMSNVTVTKSEKDLVNQRQICYRILLHHLHINYPNDKRYVAFESMPKYASELVARHLSSLDWLEFRYGELKHTNKDMYFQELFESLFCYDYGWVKLDVLTAVFSGLQTIDFAKDINGVYDREFYKNESVYSSLASFLQSHPNTKLCTIKFSVPDEQMALRLASKFDKFGWTAFCNEHNLIIENKLVIKVKK